MIAAVDALHHRSTLSEAEFAALSAHYDAAKIFEVILLCGFYRTVSYLANGLALPLEERAARFPSQGATGAGLNRRRAAFRCFFNSLLGVLRT